MKKTIGLPLLAVGGGAAAFVLRLAQNHTGFEAETGLPVAGNLPALALIALFVLLAAAGAVLVRALPAETGEGPAFPADLSTEDPRLLMLPVMGAALMALSGLADLAGALGLSVGGGMTYAVSADGVEIVATLAFSRQQLLVMGLLGLAGALGVLAGAVACRRGGRTVPGTALLIAPAALVVRLVLVYRVDSVNPALEAYYVDLLALAFLALGFYRLSSFAFQGGRTRVFAFYTVLAAVFSFAAAADSGLTDIAATALYLGGAVALVGFLVLRLQAPAGHADHDSTPQP